MIIKCVLISVLDKINFVFFVKELIEFGVEVILMGGMKKFF